MMSDRDGESPEGKIDNGDDENNGVKEDVWESKEAITGEVILD